MDASSPDTERDRESEEEILFCQASLAFGEQKNHPAVRSTDQERDTVPTLTCLCPSLSLHLSLYLPRSVYLSIHLSRSTYLSVYLSRAVSLSIYLSVLSLNFLSKPQLSAY